MYIEMYIEQKLKIRLNTRLFSWRKTNMDTYRFCYEPFNAMMEIRLFGRLSDQKSGVEQKPKGRVFPKD